MWSDILKVIENNKLAISQNEFRYKFDFLYLLRHTYIHLYDSVHSYARGKAHLGTPEVFPISNLHYIKTELML